MNKTADSKNTFKYFDAYYIVRLVQTNPTILSSKTMVWAMVSPRAKT
jgi:hypothetical protein